MTGIDELVRDALSTDAATHHAPGDLASRSMAAGRRLRRRRQAGLATVSLVSVAGVIVGSLALSGVIGRTAGRQVVIPGHQGLKHHAAAQHDGVANNASPPQWWDRWNPGRTYGDKPGAGFFDALAPGDSLTVYASGTTPDGTDFALYLDKDSSDPHLANWTQGWNDAPDYGTSAPNATADDTFLSFESPTLVAHQSSHDISQWLIVVADPDVTTAGYSADGENWQPMDVEHGIAVLKLPSMAPPDAEVRMTAGSSDFGGSLNLP